MKIQLGSAKISFIKRRDFDSKPLPRLIERFKVKLGKKAAAQYAYWDD